MNEHKTGFNSGELSSFSFFTSCGLRSWNFYWTIFLCLSSVRLWISIVMHRERFRRERKTSLVCATQPRNFVLRISRVTYTFFFYRMNHHHYQQRINPQQQLPPQIHGIRPGLNGLTQQHQIPPPIIPKQHLHQNIATLNQKPQHLLSQNSQIQPSQRITYESKFHLPSSSPHASL